MNLVRLQKIIADRGYCSRRSAEQLILDGKVAIDGKVIKELGSKFDEDTIVVKVENTVLSPKPVNAGFVYLLLNKPCGFITTLKDDRNRKTIDQLIPPDYGRVFPVGRLDINTSGAIIMTNDGDLANLIMHPSSSFPKTYIVTVNGVLNSTQKAQLEKGVMLEDGLTAPAKVKMVSLSYDQSVFEITIHEGRNRQIRRMVEAVGHETIQLSRIKIGPLELGNLRVGAFREIPKATIATIKDLCNYNRAHNTYKKD